MSYGPHTRNPWEDDQSEPENEDETLFQCACLDPDCKGHNDNPGNRRIRGKWFAEGCKVAESHPDVVGDVMAAILADEAQDTFNQRRR